MEMDPDFKVTSSRKRARGRDFHENDPRSRVYNGGGPSDPKSLRRLPGRVFHEALQVTGSKQRFLRKSAKIQTSPVEPDSTFKSVPLNRAVKRTCSEECSGSDATGVGSTDTTSSENQNHSGGDNASSSVTSNASDSGSHFSPEPTKPKTKDMSTVIEDTAKLLKLETNFQNFTMEKFFNWLCPRAAQFNSATQNLLVSILERENIFLFMQNQIKTIRANSYLMATHSTEDLFTLVTTNLKGIVEGELRVITSNYHDVLAILH